MKPKKVITICNLLLLLNSIRVFYSIMTNIGEAAGVAWMLFLALTIAPNVIVNLIVNHFLKNCEDVWNGTTKGLLFFVIIMFIVFSIFWYKLSN